MIFHLFLRSQSFVQYDLAGLQESWSLGLVSRKSGFAGNRLVFTAASEQELPLDWLVSSRVLVARLRAFEAGILKSRAARDLQSLVLITGVGPSRAAEAAHRLLRVPGLFESDGEGQVINIGTAAALDPATTALGDWVVPELVNDLAGSSFHLPAPPVTLECGATPNIRTGGRLLSVPRPVFGEIPNSWRGNHFVDMEACAQAAVFVGAGIRFSAVKGITDYAGLDAREEFASNLDRVRESMKGVFGRFLSEPSRACSGTVQGLS